MPDVFVLGRARGAAGANPFADTRCVTLSEQDFVQPGIDVFAADPARVARAYDEIAGRAIYVIGHAAHPQVTGPALLRRAADACVSGDADFLRDIAGVFVLIVDDRREGHVRFAADALGIRPWFIGTHNGQLTAGTDVLRMCKAGLSKRQINYDALGTWLVLNHLPGNDTVVTDYSRLAPGVAATFDATGKLLASHHYGALTYADEPITLEDLADKQYAAVTRVTDALLRDVDETQLLLSGGYDSRLLAAVTARHAGVRFTTLATREFEIALAKQVAAALGRPLEIVPSRKRLADFFDAPFTTTPAGFMIGMNLTNVLARRRPGVPMVCGFMGDGTMRGSILPKGTHFPQEKAGLSEAELTRIIENRFHTPDHRPNVLSVRIRKGAQARATETLRQLIAIGCATGKPLIHADLFGFHRTYFANNILQPMDVTDPIAPLCAWAIADIRTRHPQAVFGGDTYPFLFRRFFPKLAMIPHSFFEEKLRPKPPSPSTRHRRRWGAGLAGGLIAGRLRGACPLKTAGRIAVDAFRPKPFEEKELTFLYKLQLFEQTLAHCGVELDWTRLA